MFTQLTSFDLLHSIPLHNFFEHLHILQRLFIFGVFHKRRLPKWTTNESTSTSSRLSELQKSNQIDNYEPHWSSRIKMSWFMKGKQCRVSLLCELWIQLWNFFLRSKQIKHFHATLNVPPSRCCRLEFFDVNKFIRARAAGFAGELHNSRSLYCLHCFCKLRSLHSQCCRPLRLCKWKCSDYSLRTSRKSKHVDSPIVD